MTKLTQQRYIIRLQLEDRELAQWILDENSLSIGRTPDNDIVIDNLAVSRRHARIETGPEGPVIRDNGSANGLEIDGKACSEALIEDGTRVKIGKHTLSFEAESERRPVQMPAEPEGYAATIQASITPRLTNPATLVEQGPDGEISYPIDTAVFLLGKSDIADVRLTGMLVAEFHAEIKVEQNEHRISHLAGLRKLKVNGEATSECVLNAGDTIEIAGRTFRFETPRA